MDVRWSVFFARFAIIISWFFRLTATFKQQGVCHFPQRWEGTWFQSGVRTAITIEGPRLSSKGRCLGSEGDKFLMVDDKRACYRCVVIHEKHANVLQYKETFCQSRESLPTLCSLITGDALLFSMFRENAAPVACPFKGPFTFTYNRGHGECRTPVSSIDTCTEDSRLLLSYQACPDVYGSESTVEELQCLAVWKEGSSRYLVGKVHHGHATSNEDRFRCFVYEKASPASEALDGVDYRVAQSGDATCNGLFSATEGSRTMILKRAPTLNKCRFPSWVATYNHWHTLDYTSTYSFHHRNSTLRITNSSGAEIKVVCIQLKPATGAAGTTQKTEENAAMLTAHFTTGCQSGFACMSFYRRDMHVMEVQIGSYAKRPEDACNSNYFNKTESPFVTLVTSSPETRACPYSGKFHISNIKKTEEDVPPDDEDDYYDRNYYVERYSRSLEEEEERTKRMSDQNLDCDSQEFTSLVIGCNSIDTMEFRARCTSPDTITSYSCHGGWKENGTSYLITTPMGRTVHGTRRYCFMYRESGPEDLVLFSTSPTTCDRVISPGITGELIFNVTETGKCFDSSSARTSSRAVFSFTLLINILNFAVTAAVIQR